MLKLKLPRLEISQQAYYDRLDDLLHDDDCAVFLDTNILATMFALYPGARSEFAAWVRAVKPKNRLHVPAWCIQEYSNKAVRGDFKEYTSNFGTSLSATLRSLPQLIDQLTLSVDDAAAVRKQFANRKAYLNRVSDVQNELQSLLDRVTSKGDAPPLVHKEIIELFEDVVLPSDIFTLMQGCYEGYLIRYANKVPPGFHDDVKPRNKIGDYIIWQELLQTVVGSINRQTGVPAMQKILYVSNDLKNDWVYRPTFVLNAQGRPVGNPEDGGIYLVDPRLAFEMNLAAGSEVEVVLVSLRQMVNSLSRRRPDDFKRLASAVQFIGDTEPTADASTAAPPTEPVVTDAPEDATPPDTPDTAPDFVVGNDEAADAPEDPVNTPAEPSATGPYSADALADADYTIPDTIVGYAIADLKFHNWDVQKRGLGRISPTVLNVASRDDLFVLGRNILQTADGASFAARYFLERFPNNLFGTEPAKLGSLFAGMLYEVYFDSKNRFRGSQGKTMLLDMLYKAYRNHPVLRESEAFVRSVLEPHQTSVRYIPGLNETVQSITLAFTQATHSQFKFVLTDCLVEGVSVVQRIDEEDEGVDTRHLMRLREYDGRADELVAAVAESRYIPTGFFAGLYMLNGTIMNQPEPYEFYVPAGLFV